MGEVNKENAFKLLDYFYESGGNFIDTANNYQDDQSEEWIGEWMKKRGNRDEIVLATKYTSPWKKYNASIKLCTTIPLQLLFSLRSALIAREPHPSKLCWKQQKVPRAFRRGLTEEIADQLYRFVVRPLVYVDPAEFPCLVLCNVSIADIVFHRGLYRFY